MKSKKIIIPLIIAIIIVIIGLFFYKALECQKYGSFIAKIELIDDKSNSHIVNNVIVLVKSIKGIDTLSSEMDVSFYRGKNISINDSVLYIEGVPGKYSIKIKPKGYNNIEFKNINVEYLGNPLCNISKPIYFKSRIQKQLLINQRIQIEPLVKINRIEEMPKNIIELLSSKLIADINNKIADVDQKWEKTGLIVDKNIPCRHFIYGGKGKTFSLICYERGCDITVTLSLIIFDHIDNEDIQLYSINENEMCYEEVKSIDNIKKIVNKCKMQLITQWMNH